MNCSELHELQNVIHQAFGDVSRPSRDRVWGEWHDGFGDLQFKDQVEVIISTQRWETLSEKVLIDVHQHFCSLTADAKKAILPAYLRLIVRAEINALNSVIEWIFMALFPQQINAWPNGEGLLLGPDEMRWQRDYSGLNDAQRSAISKTVKYVINNYLNYNLSLAECQEYVAGYERWWKEVINP